jgi:serine/alanine adding enzyme
MNTYLPDIYYKPEYCKLYESIDNGIFVEYIYENNYGKIYYPFLKREIKSNLFDTQYYDIVSPYGYNGPIILKCLQNRKLELVAEFTNELRLYCKNNNIVSSFMRFHPILENHKDFRSKFTVNVIRKTVGITLSGNIFDEYKPECKNKIKKAIKLGVTVEIDMKCNRINDFFQIYTETMQNNKASEYYFLPYEFFVNTVKNLGDNVMLVNAFIGDEIIGSAMFMLYGDYVHYHFSGTKKEYWGYASNNLILHTVAQWGAANNKQALHLGGGRTNCEDDNLLLFKKSFTHKTFFDFAVGRNIHNQAIYDTLCKIALDKKPNINQEYFPLYRG